MAKITAEQRAELDNWTTFAARMQWKLGDVEIGTPSKEAYAEFTRKDGHQSRLTLTERQDIERAWHVAGQPKLESVSNA